jgi:hypothetical protein
MLMQTAYDDGYQAGSQWIGPNGDRSLGALSKDFICERAEYAVLGHRFSELKHGPTPDEIREANLWLRGFYAALGH